ncbi:ferritin-like domain-containing protein [Rhodocollybia butyracea]|uniref:Ferritin-like domain-containing protein n=1 Tax=Rhodocollybia butyracea TaxID=206335 RepID=A0A9P5U159_9AGAR|nr:ferritin-like domain-containing protein [Rhodocollybia butyracea]
MKFSTSLIVFISAAVSVCASTVPKAPIDDTTILNYALTLEHLENAFYAGALSNFSQEDFVHDGLPTWARGRFVQVAAHEKTHVDFLSAALGPNATKPCTYSFPYTSPSTFAALSAALEGVGVSAYAGAAQLITNKDYLTAAAVILSTEARHAAWVNSAVNKQNPWSGAFDTPLSLDVVYTLAAQFIVSCPKTNPALPVKAFPSLTLASPKAGQPSEVTAASGVPTEGNYVAFFSGLATTFVQVQSGCVIIPSTAAGTSYAVLTNSNSTANVTTILAGVAIVTLPFNSEGKPE